MTNFLCNILFTICIYVVFIFCMHSFVMLKVITRVGVDRLYILFVHLSGYCIVNCSTFDLGATDPILA